MPQIFAQGWGEGGVEDSCVVPPMYTLFTALGLPFKEAPAGRTYTLRSFAKLESSAKCERAGILSN